jgi:Predicted nucleotide-binding protein containing TIR-like domain
MALSIGKPRPTIIKKTMEFKPTIFIGSSKEGLPVAEQFASHLRGLVEVTLWPKAFEFNKSNYDNLIGQLAFYDYALLIATADDVVLSRSKISGTPRDNVLFEFGLFSGGLGRTRVFLAIEDSAKLPSDLYGITLPYLPNASSPDFARALEDSVKEIKATIVGKENTYDLGFLPSTALAYGYFVNFIERTVERLLEDKREGKIFRLEDSRTFSISALKVTILLPDDLSNDMFKKVKAKRLRDGWHKLKVDPKDIRDYDFSIDISQIDDGVLHLVDIPLTLNALNKAIELYSQKAHIGKDKKETLLEYREIRNFKRTLEYQIQSSSITRHIVSIEIVDI